MDEDWKKIEGWECYEVSNLGRVRVKTRTVIDKNGVAKIRKGRILKGSKGKLGYITVTLVEGQRRERLLVHRIVAKAFIPNPLNKPCINHIDNTPSNNIVSNLEWCTPQENTNWMIAQGRFKRTESWLKNLDKGLQPRRKRVRRIDPSTGETTVYDGINKTKKDGFTTSSVSQCCNGIRHLHHGFKWEFV